jgi:Mn2+/Fe2+ NRAMP family transporter
VQVVAATLLPPCMVFLILLLNERRIMGQWANNLFDNCINSITVVLLVVLSTVYNLLVLFPNLLSLK